MTQRILIVSDGPRDQPLYDALAKHRFEVAVESDSKRAYERLIESADDLLLIDLSAVTNAVDLIKKVRSTPDLRKTLVLVIAEWGTGQPTLALSAGADAFEPKPIHADLLPAAIDRLLRPGKAMTAKASTTEGETVD